MASTQTPQDNILIIGPSWVGDMVMAQSLFILLKRRRPDCHITVLAPAWTKPVLERMPEVDASVDLPFDHGDLKLGERRRFGQSLMAAQYSQAIVLPNSLKSALIPWFAKIPLRTGWRGEARSLFLNDCRKLDKKAYPLMVQRFAALAFADGTRPPAPESLPDPRLLPQPANVASVLTRFGLSESGEIPKKLLALCPGAEFGPSKQWPADHFATSAADLIALGWRVVILGSRGDAAIAQEIREGIVNRLGPERAEHCVNVAGETTLEEAIDLMAACTAALSNDSGLMHVAAALDLPVIALYGSTSPPFTPPLAATSKTGPPAAPLEAAPAPRPGVAGGVIRPPPC